MSRRLAPIPHVGSHLLFLEEVLTALADAGIDGPLLFRASEQDKTDRVLEHGTDRAGYGERRVWGDSPIDGRPIAHEDVILATTEEDIRRGERDPAYSTSFKKFDARRPPLLLIYDARAFVRLREKEYLFRAPDRKLEALRAVIPVDLQPEIPGWFSQEEGLAYRRRVEQVLSGGPGRGTPVGTVIGTAVGTAVDTEGERAVDTEVATAKTVVEVGCWMGRSMAWIARLCAARGAALYGVDHFAGSTDAYDPGYRAMLRDTDVAGIFLRRMEALGARVELLRCDSLEAASRFPLASLDLVFLDASHDETAVQKDLEAWWPRLRTGGVLAGHDLNDEHPGVGRAVARFAASEGLRLERGPGSFWWAARDAAR